MDIDTIVKEITKYKDVVTTIAAGFGLLFGLLGFILGLLGLLRAIRLEKDTIHAPYFKSKWPDIYSGVTERIKSIDNATNTTENQLNEPLADLSGISGKQFSDLDVSFDASRFHWDYAPELREQIMDFLHEAEKLKKFLNNFLFFAWVSTSSFLLWVKISEMGKLKSEDSSYNASAKQIEQDKIIIKKARAIYRFHLGRNYAEKELNLNQSKIYLGRVNIAKRIALFRIKKLKQKSARLMKIMTLFNSRFS